MDIKEQASTIILMRIEDRKVLVKLASAASPLVGHFRKSQTESNLRQGLVFNDKVFNDKDKAILKEISAT